MENYIGKYCTFTLNAPENTEDVVRQGVATGTDTFMLFDGEIVKGTFCNILEKPYRLSSKQKKQITAPAEPGDKLSF